MPYTDNNKDNKKINITVMCEFILIFFVCKSKICI